MNTKSNYVRGFTLVELSIVLVILGLLVGGVLTGQSLIRASELRSITTQYSSYITAVNAFKDKYFALPGDMANATTFWGVAAAGAACVTTASTTTATCDGNATSIVAGYGSGLETSPNSNEVYRFWQHLANAGLITGTYDGVTHGSTNYSSTAANSPLGKIGGTAWAVWSWGPAISGSTNLFDGAYNNSIAFGGFTANNIPSTAALKPEELWNIDTKIDDGKPATGKLKAYMLSMAACTDTSTSNNFNANYLLNSSIPGCALTFPGAF